jgi:hypothetical protein
MKQTTRRAFKITKLFDVHGRACWSEGMRGLSARNTRVNYRLLRR